MVVDKNITIAILQCAKIRWDQSVYARSYVTPAAVFAKNWDGHLHNVEQGAQVRVLKTCSKGIAIETYTVKMVSDPAMLI